MHTLTTIPEDRLALALGQAATTAAQVPPSNEGHAGLRALPKADVHCHALLNCPLSTYEQVLGHKLPLPPPRFRNFGEFGGYLAAHLFPAIRSLDGVRALLRGGLERMAEEGVVYAEASIDLLLPTHIHASPRRGDRGRRRRARPRGRPLAFRTRDRHQPARSARALVAALFRLS
jgi:hypothetical protein